MWGGHTFPRAVDADGALTDVPDAYPTHNTTLPHKHLHLNKHFPIASACPALPEEEAVENHALEDEGKRIGMSMTSEDMQRWKAVATEYNRRFQRRAAERGRYVGVPRFL